MLWHMTMMHGMLVLYILMDDDDAGQPGILVLWMVLSGMLMHLIVVPATALFRVWKFVALEAQVSNFTLFLSQI